MLGNWLSEMTNFDRYTPEICSKLRQIAEARDWKNWRELGPDDIRMEMELTYHLHLAADASGNRSGMPPMPPYPLRLPSDNPDPAQFLEMYFSGSHSLRGGGKLKTQDCSNLSCN